MEEIRNGEFAGIYTDDGISGINTKKREGFNEMIDDCMAGKIDMVITKSISRFARNTIDCLKYVCQLKEKRIAIIFEKANINTLEASGELLLTIMASLAQQESASLSQKTITTDFIEKVRIKNDGTVPQYYVKGSQEAIIKKDVYTAVQEEMVRRANLTSGIEGKKKRIYSSKYALSNICTYTKCGDIYRRIAWNNRGKKSTIWRCCTRVEQGPKACDAPTVTEEELQQATIKAINQIVQCSESMMQVLKGNIEEALVDDNSGEMEKLNAIMVEKQKELVKLAHAKKDYGLLADEIDILRDKKQELLVRRAKTEGVKKRITELADFLQGAPQELGEYDEALVRKYIEQIKIFEDHFMVCFKAKVELDIQR